jgi:dihydrolipoamide dehydrogenase
MTKKYEAAVLGGGPGGYVCAIRLAQLGKKTVLIEKQDVGGTCLNRGCIPTKALLHSAKVYETVMHASQFGIITGEVNCDYGMISAKKDTVVKTLRGGVEYLLKKNGVDIVRGEGVLKSGREISVGGETIAADNIVLATGSRPMAVPIPGIGSDNVMDSDGVLAMKEAPESLVIIGGGVIGIEFATLMGTLGKKVTVVEMLPQILSGVDEEIVAEMRTVLQKKGIKIYTSAKVIRIESSDGAVVCHYEQDGKPAEASAQVCMVAIGRKPNTEGIGLDIVGVKGERGFIEVDETMRTNVPGIYAIGDITGKMQLAHVASEQGIVAAHNIAGHKKRMHYGVIPACIYTSPEIAAVGLTEQAAKEKGYSVKTGRFVTSANGKSMIVGEKNGVVKIVTDAKTGEILGAHMMCPRATDMIAEICVVMRAEGTIDELEDTIHPHPTISEMVMEAAHDVSGLCVHTP